MSRFWIVPVAALAVALAIAAHAQSQQDGARPAPQTPGAKSEMTEASFTRQALQSGEKEVVLAKLATEKGSTSELKQLAEILVQDHTQVNEQLRLIGNGRDAAPKTGTTPSSPGQRSQAQPGAPSSPPESVAPGAAPMQSAEYQKLSKLSGTEFDKEFLTVIIDGHEKSVELYEKATTELEEGAARKLATDTLPKIKEHLQQAKSLQAQAKD